LPPLSGTIGIKKKHPEEALFPSIAVAASLVTNLLPHPQAPYFLKSPLGLAVNSWHGAQSSLSFPTSLVYQALVTAKRPGDDKHMLLCLPAIQGIVTQPFKGVPFLSIEPHFIRLF
jgi:hypothetical protein